MRLLLAAVLPLVLALLLRFFFIHHDPDLSGDPLLYGGIARNLLLHGIYGFQRDLSPTLIRLPGYPLFLAGCFKLFGIPTSGVAQYYPVLYLQALIDLGTCLLLARLAGRLAPARSARKAAAWTLWLAALCPFTACYTAAPLTETLELFSIAAALYCFARTLALVSGCKRLQRFKPFSEVVLPSAPPPSSTPRCSVRTARCSASSLCLGLSSTRRARSADVRECSQPSLRSA